MKLNLQIRDLPIRQKLRLLVIGSTLLALTLALIGFSVYERAQFRASAEAELKTLAGTVGSNAAASLAFSDSRTAQQILHALAQDADISGAYLYDTDGALFARYDRATEQTGPAPTLPPKEGAYFADDRLLLSRPVYLDGEKTGSILIVSTLDGFHVKLRRYLLIASLVLFISICITYLISALLVSAIGGPIARLAGLVTQVADSKDYSLRAQAGGSDEVGSLIQSFNQMLEKIEERDFALHNANGVLESKVQERTAALQKEIIERKQAEAKLLYEAHHDSLTHVANRRYFVEHLSKTVAPENRDGETKFAVLFIDIDRFKTINDTIGHIAGDELIKEIAKRLLYCSARHRALDEGTAARLNSDVVARIGGDEFVILLNPVDSIADVELLAESIIAELSLPIFVADEEITVTASIGSSLSDVGMDNAKDVLTDADTAMYEAKLEGRGKHRLCDPELHNKGVNRRKLESDLRSAFEREQFRVHYQPIVSLDTETVHGFEALLRWDRPGIGIVAPGHFISAAEEMGLIIPLGAWVMRQACAQIEEWNRRFNTRFKVSVNVSAKQFADPDLLNSISSMLEETRLAPEFMTVEITESLTMTNAAQAEITLKKLKEIGVGISCDDFGTGFSSLSYLHHFPLDTLKIDRSFISSVDSPRNPSGIVELIITLGHQLGMELVAEGIETKEQADKIRSLGCEFAQGYFFSHPLAPEAITNSLSQPDSGTELSALLALQ